ncbi:MAG: GH3 auxin-responsive promoter family protein [Bacteroidales bacterium]|nr:GH3 auxin-responsive promoter family protein [Bacteroidales bacterium]
MMLINNIVYQFMRSRYGQIKRYVDHSLEVQNSIFHQLIAAGKNTEWGRKYDYASIKKWEHYNERVPISEYGVFKPYVQRMQQGEQNLLWNTPIKMFAKSSGTSGSTSKYIPVSKEALKQCHYKGGVDMLILYCNMYSSSKIFSGYNLALGGSKQSNPSDSYYCGDVSAIIMDNLPRWAEHFRAPKREIALMNEWENKLNRMVESTSKQNIVSLAGVPSWMSLLLQRCLETTGKAHIGEVWKNIEVYFHGGVDFLPYKQKFKQLIPNEDMRYVNIYNASEGYFGIQDQKNVADMLLLLDNGVYYEFVETCHLGEEHPPVVQLADVEVGKNYALLITTNAGLWRYLIGDTVTFTSKYPFRIQITGRTRNYINVCGEELIEDNSNHAIKKACSETNSVIKEYTAAPYISEDKKPIGHEWVIEFEQEPTDKDLFVKLLDSALKTENSDYEAKRYKDLILKTPVVNFVKDGTFMRWLTEKNKLGGQHKVPRLKNSREVIDEILKHANILE